MNNKKNIAQTDVPAVAPVEAKKEMALLDKKIGGNIFETKVCVEPIYSKKTGKTYLKITLGVDQDKVIFVSARKDGNGVSCMTDWDDYKYTGKRPVFDQKI